MTSATHRVAVVIPCYNDGKFLPETLESVRAQEPCELVVVDDGSTEPATLALLDRLSKAGLRVVHQANGGVSVARMTGVRATSAPYIYPLDSDDLVAPGALTRLADALDANPRAVAAWGDVEIFGIGPGRFRIGTPSGLDPWLSTYVNDFPLASLLRRDALLSVGGWQLGTAYEDWDLWMAFAERGWIGVRVRHIAEIHREHAGRRWAGVLVPAHNDAILRQRHSSLFEHRRSNWRRSRAPWRSKLILPVIGRLGMVSEMNKQRLYQLVHDPGRLLQVRLRRVRQRLRRSV
ncbi:MAG: glycosyltransferase family 2 protein [Chloroflexi bacterium]|nr:MAG: glycosyltransferase family 2 protein [Chloroflexota bacterium]TMD49140.1 MAG: glycosyltransferase family 2 protein [Chloroflexota bacterium]